MVIKPDIRTLENHQTSQDLINFFPYMIPCYFIHKKENYYNVMMR